METTDSGKAKHSEKHDCFIIMPITDPDGYAKGHFQHVYEDLIAPACDMAGYKPVRADDVKQTNLIHLDVLQKLIESPMAICDLSSRNPNVLFELGLRQAFDKPVVLVQEIGTPKIFDIAPLRYFEYRKELIYHEVLIDQKDIAESLSATRDAKKHSINSIVKLLSITKPASIPEVTETNRDPALQVIRAELSDLRTEIRQMAGTVIKRGPEIDRNQFEYFRRYFRELEYIVSQSENRADAESHIRNAEVQLAGLLAGGKLSDKESQELMFMRDRLSRLRSLRERTRRTANSNEGLSNELEPASNPLVG